MEEDTLFDVENVPMTGSEIFYLALVVLGITILIPVFVDFALNTIVFVGEGAVKLYNKIRGRKETRIPIVDRNGRVVGHVPIIYEKGKKK